MELSELEQRLVNCLKTGEILDLVPHFDKSESIAAEIVSGWGARHEIRASVIRSLLCGNLVDPSVVDPRGMMIRGAKISGRLDLADLDCAYPLELTACLLPLGLNADSASFVRLSLEQCVVGTSLTTQYADGVQGAVRLVGAKVGGLLSLRGAVLSNSTGPALSADRLVVDGSMNLEGSFRASSESHKGAVRLVSAKVSGQLGLRGAVLSNSTGPALVADRLVVDGSMFLDDSFRANGVSRRGVVRLLGAKVSGQLSLRGAVLSNSTGPALLADELAVGGSMILDGSFRASGEDGGGAVCLLGAKVGGQLDLRGAVLSNSTGPALDADALTVEGDMLLSGSFRANGVSRRGVVRLLGAKVSGQLSLRGAVLSNTTGPALFAEALTVEGDMLLSGSFRANGQGGYGAVCLLGAKVGGLLSLRGAVLSNTTGPALYADELAVGGSMLLDGSFRASGEGGYGAVCLLRAKVGGQLDLRGAVLSNSTGPALSASMLIVDGNMSLDGSFRASGEDGGGAVCLLGAKVGGQLSLRGAVLSNSTGPALDAEGLAVGGDLLMDGLFRANGVSRRGVVRLLGAKVSGQLSLRGAVLSNTTGPALLAERLTVDGSMFIDGSFQASGLGGDEAVRLNNAKVGYLHVSDKAVLKSDEQYQWMVDGLTYGGYPTENPEKWLKFLQKNTVGYAAQPYQQLARAVRDAGHDGVARKILMAQRSDQLRRGKPGWKDWCWGAFTRVTVGYGYQSWLPLVWFVGILFLVWWTVAGIYPEGLATVSELQIAGADPKCSSLEKFQVALDMVSPLTSTGVEKTCKILIRDSAGETLTRISMLARVAGWALITLFVAGFTGIIRKS